MSPRAILNSRRTAIIATVAPITRRRYCEWASTERGDPEAASESLTRHPHTVSLHGVHDVLVVSMPEVLCRLHSAKRSQGEGIGTNLRSFPVPCRSSDSTWRMVTAGFGSPKRASSDSIVRCKSVRSISP